MRLDDDDDDDEARNQQLGGGGWEMRQEVERRERAARILGSWERLAWHCRACGLGEVCVCCGFFFIILLFFLSFPQKDFSLPSSLSEYV